MKIRRYLPAFFEQEGEPEIAEFNSIEELKKIDFVKRHMSCDNFHRLSITSNGAVMAEVDGGKKWWTVGYVIEGNPNLPVAVFEKDHQ